MRAPRELLPKRPVCLLYLCVLALLSSTIRLFLKSDEVTRASRPPDESFQFDAPSNAGENAVATTTINNDDESFSACILWMDDNHRLEEWLAYHYYLLKLRYVVLNVDPESRTSPDPIIDRWNDAENKYNLNMTIVVIRESDYIEEYEKEMETIQAARLATKDAEYKLGVAKTNYHRIRQKMFYKACSKHLVQRNKSWTSFHDTDEFVAFDDDFHEKKDKITATTTSAQKMEQPGYVLKRLNEIKRDFPPDSHTNETGLSCLVVSRRRYCSKELTSEEVNGLFASSFDHNNKSRSGIVPEGFMNSSRINQTTKHNREDIVRRFDTLRYKYLTDGKDGSPKSFIDLSQMNPKLYVHDQWRVSGENQGKALKWYAHKAMAWLCNKEEENRLSEIKKMVKEEHFVIGHYLGSFESYSFRDDARQGGLRSYEIWKERSNETLGEYSHVVRPWLRGFVQLVGGPDVASYLLQDAGRFPNDYDIELRIDQYKLSYDFGKHQRKRKQKKKGKKMKNGE